MNRSGPDQEASIGGGAGGSGTRTYISGAAVPTSYWFSFWFLFSVFRSFAFTFCRIFKRNKFEERFRMLNIPQGAVKDIIK